MNGKGWKLASLLVGAMVAVIVMSCNSRTPSSTTPVGPAQDTSNGGAATATSATPAVLAQFDTQHVPQMSMSRNGKIAFVLDSPTGGSALYVYSDGTSKPVSERGVQCLQPDINNLGQVAWAQLDSQENSEIILFDGGQTKRVSNGSGSNANPCIDNHGNVVWQTYTDQQGAFGADADVEFYDAGTRAVRSVTSNNRITEGYPLIGDDGTLLMGAESTDGEVMVGTITNVKDTTRSQTIANPYSVDLPQTETGEWVRTQQVNSNGQTVLASHGDILLYDGHETRNITDSRSSDNELPEINDLGQIVYQGSDGTAEQVYLYDGRSVKQLSTDTTNNQYPRLNNLGDVVWQGTKDGVWSVYLYHNGSVRQISNTPDDSIDPCINDRGDVAWIQRQSADGYHYRAIYLAQGIAASTAETVSVTPVKLEATAKKRAVTPSKDVNLAAGEEPVVVPGGAGKTDFSFIVFGDSRSGDQAYVAGHKYWKNFIRFMFGTVVGKLKPDFVLFLGDPAFQHFSGAPGGDSLADGGFRITPFTQDWLNDYKANAGSTPLYYAKGNHEMYRWHFANADYHPLAQGSVRGLVSRFTQNGTNSPHPYLDYSFVYGNTYFMCLDMFVDGRDIPTPTDQLSYNDLQQFQLDWVKRQTAWVQANNPQHAIAFSHGTLFPVSDHDAYTDGMALLLKYLTDAQFDVFLGAHEHLFANAFMGANVAYKGGYRTPFKLASDFMHITSGGGTYSLDSPRGFKPERLNLGSGAIMVATPRTHFLYVTVKKDIVHIQGIEVQGAGGAFGTDNLRIIRPPFAYFKHTARINGQWTNVPGPDQPPLPAIP